MIYILNVCLSCGREWSDDSLPPAVCERNHEGNVERVQLVRKDVADPVYEQLRLEVAISPKHSPLSDKALMAYAKETVFG